MLLETFVPLLPFVVLGLITVFVVVLLLEVQTQQSKMTTQKRMRGNYSVESILNWLIIIFVSATIVYCIVHYIIPPLIITPFSFALWRLSNSSRAQSPKQRQRYQRVPIVHPKKLQPTPKHHNSISPASKRTLPELHPLRIKLLAMVGSNLGTADRLLQQCQRENPGMKTEWYFEKVIFDLERDRR